MNPMRHIRLVLFISVLATGAAGAAAAPLHQTGHARRADKPGCPGPGKKTMTDSDAAQVNLNPVPTTVAALRALPVPPDAGESKPRVQVEKSTYQVNVYLVGAKLEPDHDFHLLISDSPGGRTMITELPDPTCPVTKTSPVIAQIAAARHALLAAAGPITDVYKPLSGTAQLTGVGFFDSVHAQLGVAPNGVELHPVLSFTGFHRAPRPHVAIVRWTARRSGRWLLERAVVRLCAPPGHAYRVRAVEHSFPRRHTRAVTGSINQKAWCTVSTLVWRFPATAGQRRHQLMLRVKLLVADLVAQRVRR
jgi:hypothetical protein